MRYFISLLCLIFINSCTDADSTETRQSMETGIYPGPVRSELLLQTSSSWDGTPIVYPEGEAEVSALLIEIEPGGETGRHIHPVTSFNYLLQGTLEVTKEDGQKVLLEAGDAVVEVTDQVHFGRNVGDEPVRLLVFYPGVAGGEL